MAAEDFFNRWSRRKTQAAEIQQDSQAKPQAADHATPARQDELAVPPPLPTMDDVEKLTSDSDFSSFVGSGVDPDVRNSAMKKLFASPNFNVMDGLDIYIGDYSKPDPMPPGMLASLLHAKDLLNPLALLEKPVMRMLESAPDAVPVAQPLVVEAAPSPQQDEKQDEIQLARFEEPPAELPTTESALPETPVEAPAAEESNPIGMEKADTKTTSGDTGSNDHSVQSM